LKPWRTWSRSTVYGIVSFAAGAGLSTLLFSNEKEAHAVHLEFYAAVAGIVPVLLVAGLVELLTIPPEASGVGLIVSLAVAGFVTETAALIVLATHRSTGLSERVSVFGLFYIGLGVVAGFVTQFQVMVSRAAPPSAINPDTKPEPED
jgi:hypothetical protein